MNGVQVLPGDCREVLKTLDDNSIDACVTDPPYALASIVKRFGNANATSETYINNAPKSGFVAGYMPRAGFMGKKWDVGDIAHSVELWTEVQRVLKPGAHILAFGGTRTYHRLACAIEDAGFEIRDQIGWCFGVGFPKSKNIGNGLGTGLKPAWEPICLGRKPLSEGTVAANVLRWGTGALNIDACRVGTEGGTAAVNFVKKPDGRHERWDENYSGARNEIASIDKGRWPANCVHDGSPEVLAAFPETGLSLGGGMKTSAGVPDKSANGHFYEANIGFGDSGSAARFFYSAKADSDDRLGSKHPTVKPVDLMQWLCRLVTPPGGTILDPFAGTGSTGEAAWREGFKAVLIEREPEYLADIARRLRLAEAGQMTRKHESAKARGNGKPIDHGPLFDSLR